MSKDAWFAQYERLEAERPDLPPHDLAELATDALIDQYAEQADRLHDERKHGDTMAETPTAVQADVLDEWTNRYTEDDDR